MKKNQMKKILLAVAMVVVVAAGLLVYSSGKTASKGTTSMGTAKGFGGDVTVTLTLADGKIIGCTAEGKDETEGVGSTAIDQLPGAIAFQDSQCPDHVCEQFGWLSQKDAWAACVPAGVYVKLYAADDAAVK